MKKLVIALLIISFNKAYSQILWNIKTDTVINYYYDFGDEFSETTLDKEKWATNYGWARSIASNKEQQYYTDEGNYEVKNGTLFLTVNRKDINAKLIDWMGENDSIKSNSGVFQGINKRDFKYAAGMIHSKRKFLKGYYEIKFKAPSDKGLWPAFWLYGGKTYNEEIDIMELKGEREDQTHVDSHCKGCDVVRDIIGQKKSFGGWIKLNGDLDKDYNVISCLWDDEDVRYFLNGKCIAVSKVKFDNPKSLVANVAVAHNKGPFHPGPNDDVVNFSPFIIDYIRVWTKDQQGGSNVSLKGTDKNPPSANTTARNKPRMLYGKKKDHVNEGIFVSLLNNEDGTYKLYCSGLEKKETYTVKFTLGNELLFEKTTNERELEIPLVTKVGLKIEVTYNGRTAEKMYLTR